MLMDVGCSDSPDAAVAATQCAHAALARLDGDAGFGIAFCGGHHDPERFLRTLRNAVGPIPVIGGAAAGAMGPGMLGTSGYESAVLLFASAIPQPRIVCTTALAADERVAGVRVAEALLPQLSATDTLLLFYDSVAGPGATHPLVIGSHLLRGIYDVLEPVYGDAGPRLIGAGTIADMALESAFVFAGDRVARDTLVAAILPDCLDLSFTVMHGCIPASSRMEITRIDGARVLELEGGAAVATLAARLGIDEADLVHQACRFGLTLGQKFGDLFAPFDERNYVNRLVVGADAGTGAVELFEADFHVGTQVQLMLTDPEGMAASAAARTTELLSITPPDTDTAALYIDCAGRCPGFSAAAVDEAEAVAGLLTGKMPWIGFYSGVEIAPYLGRGRTLDWTGVLCVLRLTEHALGQKPIGASASQ